MSSYRIKTALNNKSFTTGPDIVTGRGATVIPAARGPMKPVKINRGETERIRLLFGADRYEVLESIAYNNKYPLWISAPASGGSNAAMLMTDAGLLPIPIVLGGEPNELDMSNLWIQFLAGISDGATQAWNLSFSKALIPDPKTTPDYTPAAMIIIGDESHNATLTWEEASSSFLISAPDLGSGTISSATSPDNYLVEWTFDTSRVPAKGTKFAIRFTTDTTKLADQVYALIGMRFPCADYMATAIYKSENEGNLILDLRYIKKGVYYQQSGYPVEFSLAKGTVNGSGANIYIEEVLKFDDFIFGIPSPDNRFDWDTWTGGSDDLANFEGGDRGAPCTGQMLVEGWEQFKEFKKYPADIYFDVTADPLIPPEFSALRTSAAPYRRFLYPYPMTIRPVEITAPPNVQDRGICAFWGSAYIMNLYEPTGNLLSTLMGEVASRYADARVLSFGGRAVAWGDENQVGGQLNQGRIVNFYYDAKEDEMQRLDKYRINPIVLNELFGPMVASRRTTDTGDTDYSYSDYSMLMDYAIERIVNEVLPYQLIKFNDDNHRAVVRAKAELILKPMTQAPNNVIRDYAIKCDSENNGDDVLTRQEFVLTVAIKVTPKSEFILFNFINSAQGGSVEEDVK
jgi:hypothetical protein